MDWVMFGIGFVMGASTVTMGIMGAAMYDSARQTIEESPVKATWEAFDRDGTYLGP